MTRAGTYYTLPDGRTLSHGQLAAELGLSTRALAYRVADGWTPDALAQPKHQGVPHTLPPPVPAVPPLPGTPTPQWTVTIGVALTYVRFAACDHLIAIVPTTCPQCQMK